MSTATSHSAAAAPIEKSKVLPYTFRVTLEAERYDQLVELARRDFRKLEWQASYLLAKAITEAADAR